MDRLLNVMTATSILLIVIVLASLRRAHIRVEYSVPQGLHREILFVHDLWLPPAFKPSNQDGEVADIRLEPLEDAVQDILTGDFTLDAGAVMVDALLRLGAVPPEDPQYLDLLRLLKP